MDRREQVDPRYSGAADPSSVGFGERWRIMRPPAGSSCLLLISLLLAPLITYAHIDVDVWRVDGDVVQVQASMLAPCTPQVVWEVLTDYDNMAAYLPDMSLSHVESRTVSALNELLKVRQEGETEVGIFHFPIEVVLQVTAEPIDNLRFKSVEGNLNMQGRWQLVRAGAVTLVHYSTEIRTGFWVPPLIGPAIIKSRIVDQFTALYEEIRGRCLCESPTLQASTARAGSNLPCAGSIP